MKLFGANQYSPNSWKPERFSWKIILTIHVRPVRLCMAKQQILPACVKYAGKLAAAIVQLQSAGGQAAAKDVEKSRFVG